MGEGFCAMAQQYEYKWFDEMPADAPVQDIINKIEKEGWRVHPVMPIMWAAEDLDIKILFERKLT